MKIGLVSPYDWSYPGGVQEHILRLRSELRARGHQVRILTPATGAPGRKREFGIIKMGWAAPLHMNGSVARIALAPDFSGALRHILNTQNFDVMHIHEPLASALGLSVLNLASRLDTTVVGTFHAWARHGLTSPPEWAYASAAPFLGRHFRRLDGRIAVSPAAAEFVSRFFPATYRIIPNGVDTQIFNPNVAPLAKYHDGKLNILYLGRIEKRKGLKYLLRAIPLIREHFPNTRFLIGGDGPLRESYEKHALKAGWPDVEFLGHVPNEKLPTLYATADLFCAPSIGGESQGIVLLEALAAGRAVVASDIPGYRSVISHQRDGYLVQPARHEELAWTICHLLGDPEERLRLARDGRRRAEMFNWGHIGAEVLAYYEEVAAFRGARTRHPIHPVSGMYGTSVAAVPVGPSTPSSTQPISSVYVGESADVSFVE